MSVRTRFAPSPTGYLHIGGVRTALFNWLFARRHGGQFILRIDDTDLERNRPEALQPILDGFRWLGMNWDEGPDVGGPHGPYFQSQKLDRYKEMAHQLVAQGRAYPCLATKEELDAARKAAEAAKRPYIHRGAERDMPAEQALDIIQTKAVPIRLKVPIGETLLLHDLIRGEVAWQTDIISDPVILRPDGRALYNFATVIDDVDLRISHVIRAEEHLTNTNVQLLVYKALGVERPAFAHVPVVNYKGKKMSKRALPPLTAEERTKLKMLGWSDEQIQARDDLNIATVAFYRELGYLPAALVNYLGRLGWSLDEKTEFIPLPDMIAHFSLERVISSPGNFDADKLFWLAGEYMRLLTLEEKCAGVLPFMQKAKLIADPPEPAALDRLKQVVQACGDRIKLFSDILTYGAFFFTQDPAYDLAALKKRVHKEGVPAMLAELIELLKVWQPFDKATLEQELHAFCQERNLKAADVNHALRVSVTGVPVGPGLFDCLVILGREETIRRIQLAMRTSPA